MLRNKRELYLEQAIWSSHADPNSFAYGAIKFLNVKEEHLFVKLLRLGHKIHQQKILCCLILLLPHRKNKTVRFFHDSLLFKLFHLRDVFPGDFYQKMLCEVCLLSDGKWIEGKSFVVPICTSFFCLWEVSIAVIHGGTSIENSFLIVVRLLKSKIWSKLVNIAGVLGTVWSK